MRLRNTSILIIIAAAFLVYFFAVEQPRHKQERENLDRSTKITDLKREDIYHVTIMRSRDTLSFTREAGSWRMTAPVRDKAADAYVNTLISSAVNARIERTLQMGAGDETRYGLGLAPAATLRLQTATRDTTLTIRLGGHNITKSHFYAQVGTSNDVLLLPAGLRRYATQEIAAFRDRSMIDFAIDDITKLDISSADRTLLWHRDPSHRWATIMDGDTVFGDSGEIEAILRRMRGIEVREFLSDDPSDLPKYFEKEAGSISFWTGKGRVKHSVHFSTQTAETCNARVDGNDRIISIEAKILRAFDKSYDDLRDRNVFRFQHGEVSKIHVVMADTSATTIIRTGSEWAFANPALGGIDQNQVNLLFRNLENMRYTEITENRIRNSSAEKFREAPFRITLYGPDENAIDELSCLPHPHDASLQLATSRSSRLLGRIPNENLLALKATIRNIHAK